MGRTVPLQPWFPILVEEVGEVGKALNEDTDIDSEKSLLSVYRGLWIRRGEDRLLDYKTLLSSSKQPFT